MNLITGLRQNERWATLASHILVGGLMTFFAIGFIQLGTFFILDWNASGMIIVSILITVEAIFSYRILKNRPDFGWNPIVYYVVEWIVIAILIKLFTELRFGISYFWGNILGWSKNFFENFLTKDFIINIILVTLIWVITSFFAQNLAELEGDEMLTHDPDVSVNRQAIHQEIRSRFLKLGLVLIAIAGILRQDRINLINRPQSQPADVSFVIYYFLIGLVLLSLTNLASMRASWLLDHVVIQHNLVARWILYSLLFVAFITGISALLPTHYTVGLLTLLGYLIQVLIYIVKTILDVIMFIFYFFSGIIAYLLRLLAGDQRYVAPLPLETITPEPPRRVTAPIPNSFSDIAGSLLFWIVLITVLVFAFSQYIQRNKEFAQLLGRFRIGKWLIAAFDWMRGILTRGGRTIRLSLQNGIRRFNASRVSARVDLIRNNFRLPRLSPRQKVLFYYHAFLRRADDVGLARRKSLTPREYSVYLDRHMAGKSEDLDEMTGAFVEARYTQHEISEGIVERTRTIWDRLRSSLRLHRKSQK